jgi:hypothetical protein
MYTHITYVARCINSNIFYDFSTHLIKNKTSSKLSIDLVEGSYGREGGDIVYTFQKTRFTLQGCCYKIMFILSALHL